MLDGQIRELDEPFEVLGMEAPYPSGFGIAGEDINCRCALLQRARWALDEDELETLKDRAKYFGLDKTNSFEKFQAKYLSVDNARVNGIIKSIDVDDFKMVTYGKNIYKEVEDTILNTFREAEKRDKFFISEVRFKDIVGGKAGIPILQIEPTAHGTLILNINNIIAGKTLKEINEMFENSNLSVANTLEEAIIHECGHAKLIKGMRVDQIEKLYSELANIHIDGISKIARDEGVECIAEVEVLLSRGDEVPREAMELYNKYIKRK